MNYNNKIVWITGASSGIGEALAYAFAQKGARLILSARNMPELERVKKGCVGAASVDVVRLDIGAFDAVFETAQKVIERYGQIDILVNNAGISQRGLAKDTTFDVDKTMVEVNLLGTIALTKAVLPSMLAVNNGHIVVVSSLMGTFGAPMRSAYAAAKHGLHGFFDTLRAEVYQQNIKVLLVCPGFVRTNISINALTKDGTIQGTMDDATGRGLPPSVVAEKTLRAIASGREQIIVGGRETMGYYLKRFFPGILSRVVRKAKTT